MKKTLSFVLLTVLSIFTLAFIPSHHMHAADSVKVLTPATNHILADVNQTLSLTDYAVKTDTGQYLLSEATLSSTDAAVTINTGISMVVSEVGVFKISVTHTMLNLNIYVVTKLATDDTYVLYEEDFETVANGALPSSLTMRNNVGAAGGSAAMVDHQLFLSAYTQVLFPEYLSSFSNYIIEADMKMSQAANDSRWTSIMFRYTTENYFQMAVRQNATAANGVEFAKRISGGWNVPMTASYSEALDPQTYYNLKVDVFETNVKEYINDELLVEYDNALEYIYGRIGVQADNSSVYYDNIRITMPETYISEDVYPFTKTADVYEPETGIVQPATTLVWFNEASQLDIAFDEVRPATMIFRINENMDIVDADNQVLSTVMDAMITIDGKMIPAFYTDDILAAEALAQLLKTNRIYDSFIISKDADVIQAARDIHSLIRGILDFEFLDKDELTVDDMLDIRYQTNTAGAVASLLPAELVHQEEMNYMLPRVMTIFLKADSNDASLYSAILSGAHGIVAEDYERIYEIYETFTEVTHVRRPLTIAHRSLFNSGTVSPENTVEAALESIQHGADIMEIDVMLTLDWEVVLMHDATTARTAPDFQSYTINQTPLATLKSIHLYDPNGTTDVKIPTLDEYLAAVKGSGTVIYIEIKAESELLVERVKEIIDEQDMYDQAAIIAFSQNMIQKANEVMPEISTGNLNSSVLNASDPTQSLQTTLATVVPINSTLNPSYTPLTADYMKMVRHRGLTVWPWTLNDNVALATYYQMGVSGLTTDYTNYFENTFNGLRFEQNQFSLQEAEVVGTKLNAAIVTPNDTAYRYVPTMITIDDGETGITFDQQGNITAYTQPGDAYYYAQFQSALPNGESIVVLSDIVHIQIVQPEPVEPTSNTWMIPVIVIGSLSVLSLSGFFIFRKLKIKKI